MSIEFVCALCGEVHIPAPRNSRGWIELPETITTSKNKDGSWYFHCERMCWPIRQDVGIMDPYEAWATANDHESWTDILIAWNRVHAYRWIDGCMVYPLSLEVSRSRRAIADAAYVWLAAYYRANHG